MDKKTDSLIRGYFEKSREKLRVSRKLLEGGDLEDAVSRSYYSAFHAAQAVLLTEGLAANTHQGLVNLFGMHFVKTGKFENKFGKYLSNLKDGRENGDYEIFSGIDLESAQAAFREAEEFQQAALKYLRQFVNGL